MARLCLLSSCLLALWTLASVQAQSWDTCSSGSYELFFVVDDVGAEYVISVRDEDGNTLVAADTVDSATNDYGVSDWVAETNGQGSVPAHITDMSAEKLWTIEIDKISDASAPGKEPQFPTFRFSYYACGPYSDLSRYGFFCPNEGIPSGGDGDVYLVASGNSVHVVPAPIKNQFGPGLGMVQGVAGAVVWTTGSNDFVLPYNVGAVCTHPNVECGSGALYDWSIFISPQAESPYTPLASQWDFPSGLTVPSARTWRWGPQTARFRSGYGIEVDGVFDADGTTMTARVASAGWSGIDFELGSTGLFSAVTVEGVAGAGEYMIDIKNGASSVRITDSLIRDAHPSGYVSGIRASGASLDVGQTTEDVYLAGNTIRDMTGDGITLASGAAARIYNNTVLGNGGDGIVVGYNSEAFVSRPPNYDLDASNVITGNDGYGSYATFGADVTTGFYYYPIGGYTPEGFNLVTGNATGGLHAAYGADYAAGSLSQHFNNSILENGAPGSQWFDGFGPDASASGASSSVIARNDWWGRPTNPDTTSLASGAYDAFVAVDPMLSAAPGSGSLREGPEAGHSAKGDTSPDETGTRALYLAANEARGVSLLDGVISAAAGRPKAAQALGDLARLSGRELVSELDAALALAILEREASGARADHRAWALQGLVKAHHLRGRRGDALIAATALVAEGGDGALYGRVARAYLLAELGDPEGARAEVDAVAALAPGSREARLVRGALGVVAIEASEPAPKASPLAEAAAQSPALNAPYPNPTTGGALVPFALSADADVHLAVYDALGREVAVLARGPHSAGPHSARLDARALAPGVYLVRLSAGVAPPEAQRLTVAN